DGVHRAVRERQSGCITEDEGRVESSASRLVATDSQETRRRIDAGDARPTLGREQRRVPGPATEVDHALPTSRGEAPHCNFCRRQQLLGNALITAEVPLHRPNLCRAPPPQLLVQLVTLETP